MNLNGFLLLLKYILFVCLFVRATELTNTYCNPQLWGVLNFGFYLSPRTISMIFFTTLMLLGRGMDKGKKLLKYIWQLYLAKSFCFGNFFGDVMGQTHRLTYGQTNFSRKILFQKSLCSFLAREAGALIFNFFFMSVCNFFSIFPIFCYLKLL